MERGHTGWRIVGALLSGLLVSQSYPPGDRGALIWIALVPLLLATEGQSARRRFLFGYLTGIVTHLGMTWWVGGTLQRMSGLSSVAAGAVVVLFVLTHGLNLALFAWLGGALKEISGRWWLLTLPVLWLWIEYLFPLVFPWYVGNAVYRWIVLIQIADVTGVYGLSFVILLANCGLVEMGLRLQREQERPYHPLIPAAAVFILCVVYGHWRLGQLERAPIVGRLRVAMIQPNLTPNLKQSKKSRVKIEMFERQQKMSLTLGRGSHDLIVWPEGAFPWYFRDDGRKPGPDATEYRRLAARYSRRLFDLARQLNSHLLFGTLRRNDNKSRNSAYLIRPDGRRFVRYDKIRVVPFGEHVPFTRQLPFLKALNRGYKNIHPGRHQVRFSIAGVELVPSICYEATFPGLTRRVLSPRTRVLVNLTNDQWFGQTRAAHLHLMVQQLRAVENRLTILRATNSGITVVVQPNGRMRQPTRMFVSGIVSSALRIRRLSSLYRRVGDLFLLLLSLGLVGFLGLRFDRLRRR